MYPRQVCYLPTNQKDIVSTSTVFQPVDEQFMYMNRLNPDLKIAASKRWLVDLDSRQT